MTDELTPAQALDAHLAEHAQTDDGRTHAARLDRIAALSKPRPEPRWTGWVMLGIAVALIGALAAWRLG